MANQRFAWSRAGKAEACLELRKRNFVRRLNEHSSIPCLVCGKKPHAKDDCYYPAANWNTQTNKVIGHKQCVDSFGGRVEASVAAHEYREHELRRMEKKGVIPNAGDLPPVTVDELSVKLDQVIAEFRKEVHEDEFARGFRAGFEAALAKIQKAGLELRR